MSILKCKICEGDLYITGEVSIIEPAIKCKGCGFTNKHNSVRKKKKVVIEYR